MGSQVLTKMTKKYFTSSLFSFQLSRGEREGYSFSQQKTGLHVTPKKGKQRLCKLLLIHSCCLPISIVNTSLRREDRYVSIIWICVLGNVLVPTEGTTDCVFVSKLIHLKAPKYIERTFFSSLESWSWPEASFCWRLALSSSTPDKLPARHKRSWWGSRLKD